MDLKQLAIEFDADEAVDISDFQRRARVLQSMWRKEHGFGCEKTHCATGTRPLGSRLKMPKAEEKLRNFLTEVIAEVVKAEVCDAQKSKEKMFVKPRIFDNLLASQPLCFNLFGELTRDLNLASKVIESLTAGRFMNVTEIDFEYSPGRGNPEYLNDRSAFDVFLRCSNAVGGTCFIGIKVKYHENLKGPPSADKPRYCEVAKLMGCFSSDHEPLKQAPLQQIWRDHLLSGITRIKDHFDDALFVTLYPKDNTHVSDALCDYRKQLTDEASFATWTLEAFVQTLQQFSDAAWINAFIDRYLAFDKIDARLRSVIVPQIR